MPVWTCVTCGTLYPDSEAPPESCAICLDGRQYVPAAGQRWTTIDRLVAEGHRHALRSLEPGLVGIQTVPHFAIGQEALLVMTPEGNLLWDAVSLVDDLLIRVLRGLGGLRAIAVSHPHFYSGATILAERTGADVYLSASDREWLQRPSPTVTFVEEPARELFGGLTLLRLGGHFPGSQALLWPRGAKGRGVLLSSDTVSVNEGGKSVSFMWSFPNKVPLPAEEVHRIGERLDLCDFDRIYGGWPGSVIHSGAKEAVRRSVQRYIDALAGDL